MLKSTEPGRARQVQSLDGGWNIGSRNSELEDNQVYDIQNFQYDINGSLNKRPGITNFQTALAGGNVNGLAAVAPGQALGILAASGLNIYKSTYVGSWGAFANIGAIVTNVKGRFVNFTSANPNVSSGWNIFLNGADPPYSYNAAAWGVLAGWNAATGNAPGTYGGIMNNVLFISTNTPGSRVFFSAPGNPVSWAATNFVDVGVGIGLTVSGIIGVPSQQVLYVFKDQGVFAWTGVSVGSISITPIATDVGCIFPDTIRQIRGQIFFLGRTTDYFTGGSYYQVFCIVNNTIIPVSFEIEPFLNNSRSDFTGMNQNLQPWAFSTPFAIANYPYYELCIPTGSGTTPTVSVVLDVRTRKWTKFTNRTFGCSARVDGYESGNATNPSLYLAGSATSGQVYQLYQGFTDSNNSSNVEAYVISKGYNFGDIKTTKFFSELYVTPELQSSTYLPATTTIAYDTDWSGSYTNTIPVPTSMGHRKDSGKVPFREARFKFDDASSSNFVLGEVEFEALIEPARYQ